MLSQASVAKKIGMLPNKLASILNCKRELKISDFFTLCDVLEIEPNKFYSGMKRESIFCCGKALKAITITDEENSAVAVITDGVIIEHKGYKVVLSEI